MNESEELETQKKIYLLISKHPGLTLSGLAEMLSISLPLALYHLRYLEKQGLIASSKEEEASQRYYLVGDIGTKDKKYLSLFRKEMLLKIVLILLKKPNLRHKELLEYLEISPPLLTYYLKKLQKQGIIAAQEDGQQQGYFVLNEKEIIAFLLKYEPYKIMEGISNTWTDFTIR